VSEGKGGADDFLSTENCPEGPTSLVGRQTRLRIATDTPPRASGYNLCLLSRQCENNMEPRVCSKEEDTLQSGIIPDANWNPVGRGPSSHSKSTSPIPSLSCSVIAGSFSSRGSAEIPPSESRIGSPSFSTAFCFLHRRSLPLSQSPRPENPLWPAPYPLLCHPPHRHAPPQRACPLSLLSPPGQVTRGPTVFFWPGRTHPSTELYLVEEGFWLGTARRARLQSRKSYECSPEPCTERERERERVRVRGETLRTHFRRCNVVSKSLQYTARPRLPTCAEVRTGTTLPYGYLRERGDQRIGQMRLTQSRLGALTYNGVVYACERATKDMIWFTLRLLRKTGR
jgi:hypothetical protein